MTRHTARFVLLAVLALACMPVAVRADAAADAQQHFAQGTRAYNIQDWATALREYKEAYTLDPRPELLWAIAQTQRLSGDCKSAVLTYRAFLRSASSTQAHVAQERIAKCESELAAQERASERARPAPLPTPEPESPAPSTTLSATHAARHGASEPRRPWFFDPLGDVLVVSGIGALALGGTLFALGNEDMLASARAKTYQHYDREIASARTKQEVGLGVLAGGALLTGLSVWRFSWVRAHGSERRVLTLQPRRGGALASFRASF